MWATTTTVSFPFYTKVKLPNSLSTFATSNRNSLKLKASLSDYPLASRIMVRNLPYSTNESSLQEQFSNFGQIAEVKLVKNGATNRSKGFAFIQYTCQEDAMLALETMDNENFDGRVIYVELAKPGGDAYKGYLRTLGPPKVPHLHLHLQEQDEVPDCWY